MEEEEQKETEKHPLRVDNFLLWVFDTLAEKGWAYLGLVPHPESQKMEEDLGQVKLVIPLLEKIFELVKEQVPFQRRIQMETMITNIQLNFVKKQEGKKS
ncbi:MAG: DUF1844 domain-containing protein [bacterium JZ-2024 1]